MYPIRLMCSSESTKLFFHCREINWFWRLFYFFFWKISIFTKFCFQKLFYSKTGVPVQKNYLIQISVSVRYVFRTFKSISPPEIVFAVTPCTAVAIELKTTIRFLPKCLWPVQCTAPVRPTRRIPTSRALTFIIFVI